MKAIYNGIQVLPNWILRFNEVSNNVYYVSLTDSFGRVATSTDDDIYNAIKVCEEYAFDIEKQISKNWKDFLFEYTMLKLKDADSLCNGMNGYAYGSWSIKVNEKIFFYDGRDEILIVKKINADSFNYRAVALKDFSFKDFNSYIDFIKTDTSSLS